MTRTLSLAALLLATCSTLLPGCSKVGVVPPVQGDLLETLDFRAASMDQAGDLVGITFDPDTGSMIVMDATYGIWEIAEGENDAHLILRSDEILYDLWPESSITDIAALGDGRFALTARSAGYILDIETAVATTTFCYEPGWDGEWDEDRFQISDAVTYDPVTELILAQPRTFEGGTSTDSTFGAWAETGGEPVIWNALSAEFQATGMAVDGDGNVLMVAADQLYRYAIDDDSLISLGRIDTHGITEASGMAWSQDTGTVWVLDGPSQQIVELRLD